MLIRRLIVSCAILAAASAGEAVAQERTFDNPTYRGFEVSYCGVGSTSCGERMATTFCEANGYDYASEWAARAGIEGVTRAVRLDNSTICEGAACDAFATITCGRGEQRTFTMPTLGSAARATVLSPNLRTTEAVLDPQEYRVLIPGCTQGEPGVFMCKSILEYQHCRTLMIGQFVFACQAGLAFEGGFAQPFEAEDGEYELVIESDARIRVNQGDRGPGQIRGKAEVELTFRPPTDSPGSWCLQRDPYIYYPSGPDGGMSEFGDTGECGDPIELSFAPHADDAVRAYDLCESFAAWGSEMQDTIDILVSGLFHIRSANPEFIARHGDDGAVLAPYIVVKAPLSIDCRS